MSEISEMIRKTFGEGDVARDAGLKTPEDIVRYDDILYGEDKKWQVLDIYRPKAAKDALLPVIVSVHGGAWVYGDKEAYQFYCMSLAERGFAVINYTYRLAPEHKYPASLEDTNRVIHWLYKHADSYGFDLSNIFAVGDSAGAHCLALYTAICTNTEYAAEYEFQTPERFIPKAIALNCGQYKTELSKDKDDMTMRLMADYLPEKGSVREMEAIDVTAHITNQYPPVFLMTCQNDFLKNQAPILVHKLMERNIPFVYRYFTDPQIELTHVFHCNIKLKAAERCNNEECEFFRNMI